MTDLYILAGHVTRIIIFLIKLPRIDKTGFNVMFLSGNMSVKITEIQPLQAFPNVQTDLD